MKPSTYYTGITGIIERIEPLRSECCNQMISLRTIDGMTNFVLSPGTYVTDNTPLRAGMRVTAFYDMNQPVPLIYPPQYQAAFIARTEPGENVMVAYFNERLLSSENPLQLNISQYPCYYGQRPALCLRHRQQSSDGLLQRHHEKHPPSNHAGKNYRLLLNGSFHSF